MEPLHPAELKLAVREIQLLSKRTCSPRGLLSSFPQVASLTEIFLHDLYCCPCRHASSRQDLAVTLGTLLSSPAVPRNLAARPVTAQKRPRELGMHGAGCRAGWPWPPGAPPPRHSFPVRCWLPRHPHTATPSSPLRGQPHPPVPATT